MIVVTSRLWLWQGSSGSWHFLTIPPEESIEIRLESAGIRRGFGSVRVRARIGGVAWTTSVFPQKDGSYILPVKVAVRRDCAIAADDMVKFGIELL